MDHELVVLSPEKTILTYRLAGLGSRILAHLLDIAILYAVMTGAAVVLSIVFAFLSPGLGSLVVSMLVVTLPFLYFILFEGLWNGQTPGKKAGGVRVRMADGTPITFRAAVARNLIRPADMIPATYFAGIIAILTNPRSQRLGDMVAGTVLVYEKRPVANYAPAPHTAGIHPFESQVGSLRGMTIEEYNALRRLCDRFPELPKDIQERMMADIWNPIAMRRKVPSIPNVHPLYLAEATVMKYGREHGLL